MLEHYELKDTLVKYKLQLIKNITSNDVVEIETPQSVVMVGANGSGKTRLGAWIELESSMKDRVHRVSAQKSLSMPSAVMSKSIEIAKKELWFGKDNIDASFDDLFYKRNSRWGSKPAIHPLNDFEKLMVYLFSDKTEESSAYLKASQLSEDKVMPPQTKLDVIKNTWEKILPHRQLIINGLDIQTATKEGDTKVYSASDMSDGERVVFYLIGQSLAAPEKAVIVIDEPELHLHKAVQAPLWIEIQKLRPDCLFVYLTHDVDFAVSLPNSKKIWLKSYDGQNWDWEIIKDIDGMPEKLLLEILGSRKPVVLIEGEKGSHDTKLYQAILEDFLVVPSGSCTTVIQTVKSLRDSQQFQR